MSTQSDIYEEILKILGGYAFGITVSCFSMIERRYHQTFYKSLDYETLGLKNIEELLDEMLDKRMLLLFQDPGSTMKYVMSARVVEGRLEGELKRNVRELLYNCSGEIPLSSFQSIYKNKFMVNLKYSFYGLTGFDHLCKVLNLVVEVGKSGEKVIKESIMCDLGKRKRNE